MNELSEAEGGNLRAQAFPLQLRNGRRQWSQVAPKLMIFSMNPGILVKLLTL